MNEMMNVRADINMLLWQCLQVDIVLPETKVDLQKVLVSSTICQATRRPVAWANCLGVVGRLALIEYANIGGEDPQGIFSVDPRDIGFNRASFSFIEAALPFPSIPERWFEHALRFGRKWMAEIYQSPIVFSNEEVFFVAQYIMNVCSSTNVPGYVRPIPRGE